MATRTRLWAGVAAAQIGVAVVLLYSFDPYSSISWGLCAFGVVLVVILAVEWLIGSGVAFLSRKRQAVGRQRHLEAGANVCSITVGAKLDEISSGLAELRLGATQLEWKMLAIRRATSASALSRADAP